MCDVYVCPRCPAAALPIRGSSVALRPFAQPLPSPEAMSTFGARARGRGNRTPVRNADNWVMRVTRCPRCRAEDIAADAHPARVLNNGVAARWYVCRGCYRPTELEYRIACDTAGIAYRPLPIRDALRGLREFYLARIAEWDDSGHPAGRAGAVLPVRADPRGPRRRRPPARDRCASVARP